MGGHPFGRTPIGLGARFGWAPTVAPQPLGLDTLRTSGRTRTAADAVEGVVGSRIEIDLHARPAATELLDQRLAMPGGRPVIGIPGLDQQRDDRAEVREAGERGTARIKATAERNSVRRPACPPRPP